MKKIKWKLGIMSAMLFAVMGVGSAGATETPSLNPSKDLKFLLSPMKQVEQSTGVYWETVDGGEKLKYTFYLQNLKNENIDVWVYPADAKPGANGGKIFSQRNEELSSAGSWVEPSYSYKVSLKPKEKRNLVYEVDVPKDINPGQYVAVIAAEEVLEQQEAPEVEQTKAVLMIDKAQRMGTQIVLEHKVEQAKHEMTIDSFKHEYIANGYSQVEVKLSNTGTILERPNGIIEIKDKDGKGVFSKSYNNAPKEKSVYGGTTASMVYPITDKILWPGEYTAYFEANYSGKKVSKTFKFIVTEDQASKSQESLDAAGLLQGGGFGHWLQNNKVLAGIIGGAALLFILAFFFLLFLLLKRKKKDKDEKFDSKFTRTPQGEV